MAIWLLKTEPDTYAWADLQRDGRAVWDGVTNAAALANIRRMTSGDEAWFYHTGKERQIVGLAKVVSDPYADPKQKDERLVVVDLEPLRPVKKPVTLAAVKADDRFADFALVRQGRLSVVAVPAELHRILRTMAGLAKG